MQCLQRVVWSSGSSRAHRTLRDLHASQPGDRDLCQCLEQEDAMQVDRVSEPSHEGERRERDAKGGRNL